MGNSIGGLACLMVRGSWLAAHACGLRWVPACLPACTRLAVRCSSYTSSRAAMPVVELQVAADAPKGAVRGAVLLNSAGAMNNKVRTCQ